MPGRILDTLDDGVEVLNGRTSTTERPRGLASLAQTLLALRHHANNRRTLEKTRID